MQRFSAPRAGYRAWIAAALLGVSAAAVGADTLSPDERLAAIRKGLVQAALEGPTQVSATQWIDASGALQESSSFRAGMEVRGVRVLGYDADAQGDPLARLQWVGAERTGSLGAPAKQPQCSAAHDGALQHLLAWSWADAGQADADTAPLLASLQASVLAQLQQGAGAPARWRLVARPGQSLRSSYQQALLGSSLDNIPWQLQFQTDLVAAPLPAVPVVETSSKSHGAGAAPASAPAEPQGVLVRLRMALMGSTQTQVALQSSTTLPLQAEDNNWGPPSLSASTREQVAAQVRVWTRELQQHLGCLPVVADVVQAAGTQVRINVGSASGVRVGDEWVLAHDKTVVQRALEPGVVDHTVLARVQAVGPYHAELRAIAGNPNHVKPRWTAWSAKALR